MYKLIINVEGRRSSIAAAHAVASEIGFIATAEAKLDGHNGQWIITSITRPCLGRIQTKMGRTEGGVRDFPCVIFCRD